MSRSVTTNLGPPIKTFEESKVRRGANTAATESFIHMFLTATLEIFQQDFTNNISGITDLGDGEVLALLSGPNV